jgi:hypothetical protein
MENIISYINCALYFTGTAVINNNSASYVVNICLGCVFGVLSESPNPSVVTSRSRFYGSFEPTLDSVISGG